MLSCSCQVDSVLNTVTSGRGEAAIYVERQETRVKKVFPLENQTGVTKSLFISITELQNFNIMQIKQLFTTNQSDRPLCRTLVRVLLLKRKGKFKKGKASSVAWSLLLFGLNQLCVKYSRRGSHKRCCLTAWAQKVLAYLALSPPHCLNQWCFWHSLSYLNLLSIREQWYVESTYICFCLNELWSFSKVSSIQFYLWNKTPGISLSEILY